MSLGLLFAFGGDYPAAASPPPPAQAFVKKHCIDCHAGEDGEGGLDLEALTSAPDDRASFERWVRIFDRVQAGEMPPPDSGTLKTSDVQSFTKEIRNWLIQEQTARVAKQGRVQGRRLTNLQLERTLQDLLGIDDPLSNAMPEEPRTGGFTTVADGQTMSHVQMEQHLAVVDLALDIAFQRAMQTRNPLQKSWTAEQVARTNPRKRCREPEMLNGSAVVWASRLIFYGRLPVTTAPEDGWYRFTLKASALNLPSDSGVWCTVRTGRCVSSAPLLEWATAFEAVERPKTITFEAWVPKGHMLEIRPNDSTLKQARFSGGQVGAGEGTPQKVPGLAMHSLTMERIYHGPDDAGIRKLLLGPLQVKPGGKKKPPQLFSSAPEADLAMLIQDFAIRAFRRPVGIPEVAPYIEFAQHCLQSGDSLETALRAGYRAVLCSPRFLYLHEAPGPLDDYALASRLSYFVWGSMPDETLLQLAAEGRLSHRRVLLEQLERMLAHPRGQTFVQDFASEWLDLHLIDFTEPDRKMHPDFDSIVQQSMLEETHAFLQEMLEKDLSVTHLIDADFTFLNSRLARFYGVGNVSNDKIRRFKLRPNQPRGGLITHGAVLKVTANGTTTSPVTRGAWVAERILGDHVPPPPKNVPAVEPDIRGASTIREMLEKHRSDVSCASCHVKIDPPGFALENFDPAGRWRTNYLVIRGRSLKPGAEIDASYRWDDGRSFEDLRGFQKLTVQQPERLARNLSEKLITYSTGAQPLFADRDEINRIVDESQRAKFGFKSILQGVVTSSIFSQK